jgi:hypothetical protein
MEEVVDVSSYFGSVDGAAITIRKVDFKTVEGDGPRIKRVVRISANDFVMAVTGQESFEADNTILQFRHKSPRFFESLSKFEFMGPHISTRPTKSFQYVVCLSECLTLMSFLGIRGNGGFGSGSLFGTNVELYKSPTDLLTCLFAGDPIIIVVNTVARYERANRDGWRESHYEGGEHGGQI